MKIISRINIIITIIVSFLFNNSCVKIDDFDTPKESCNDLIIANKTIEEIYNSATNIAVEYKNEDYIEGYVVSSDQQGNIFKNISLQSISGEHGFSIPIDQTDLYTIYNVGRKVLVNLKGSYIEIDNDMLRIGELFVDNFNNETAGRIHYPLYENIVIKSCEVIDEKDMINRISIQNVSNNYLNTLVEFENVQFINTALGNTMYDKNNDSGGSATKHLIQNSSGASLPVRTSAFADFAKLNVPEGNGTIRGVLTKFREEYQLIPRAIEDINLDKERIEVIPKNNVFFTELADPNNNSAARFIEIYNGEEENINLSGWTIRRYTNANATSTSSIDLTGSTIAAGQAFVIAAQASAFEAAFGFPPDLAADTGGPADSNGDDNLELVDPEGNVVDVFGVPGEDGTGTNHEFEDGRANRKASVIQANATYTFAEWDIWNDSGDSETTNEPQDAPGNFTPGVR